MYGTNAPSSYVSSGSENMKRSGAKMSWSLHQSIESEKLELAYHQGSMSRPLHNIQSVVLDVGLVDLHTPT